MYVLIVSQLRMDHGACLKRAALKKIHILGVTYSWVVLLAFLSHCFYARIKLRPGWRHQKGHTNKEISWAIGNSGMETGNRKCKMEMVKLSYKCTLE